AFVSMDQMDDFTEFSPDAIRGLRERFMVAGRPQVNKVKVNTASLRQLSRFPYFNRDIARAVITQRSMNGKIAGIHELLGINGFPVDKVEIIALYLEF
ncbi:MAG TPA: helix-hairpin-helix domain-containing protein, partial [Flavobacterium sp.]|nr:helix-hairpin-helix domain-containing protein [Flavobacterium sp.]